MSVRRTSALVFFSCVLFACGDETGLRVIVDSNIPDLRSFSIDVYSGELAIDSARRSHRDFSRTEVTLPASMGIVPRGGEASRRVRIEVAGVAPSGSVRASVVTGFVSGETREVWIVLSRACVDHACGEGLTCDRGDCVAQERPPSTLPRPGSDASVPADASSPADARVTEASVDSPVDAGRDTGGPPEDAGTDAQPPVDAGPFEPCPPEYRLEGSRCYSQSSYDVPWADAEARCAESGAHLVAIGSMDEQVLVGELLRGDPDAWSGLGPVSTTETRLDGLRDTDTAGRLCRGDAPLDLAGVLYAGIDFTAAHDDIANHCAGAGISIGDVGITLRLAGRWVLVLSTLSAGGFDIGSANLFAGPCDAGGADPLACVGTSPFGGGLPTSAATLAGPGEVGVVADTAAGTGTSLRVIPLGWTSGEDVSFDRLPSGAPVSGTSALPCIAFRRDQWQWRDCSESQPYVCEIAPRTLE